MQEYLSQLNEGTEVLLVLSIILFAGFIMTRLTNTLNLPKVSGYILAGLAVFGAEADCPRRILIFGGCSAGMHWRGGQQPFPPA